MRYDVIIIGSGLGGLECGSILSRQGKSVLVLERQAQAGGCMQSYIRKGHAYDTGLHYVGGLAEGQSLFPAFKYLGLLDLPWKHLDPQAFDKVTIKGETFSFAEGYENFANTLSDRFPKERAALHEYVDFLRKIDESQLEALTSEPSSESNLMDSLYSTNAYEWLNEKFDDKLLINVLSGTSLKMELRKETLPLFTFTHGNSGFIQSSWRLDGDGNMLVEKLVSNIKSNGGEVVCNAEVTELAVADGKIHSAICSNGEVYEAETFICNIHPAAISELVKDNSVMKGIYKRRMSRLQNTFGMFTCSILLKDDSIPYFNHNKFIYTCDDVWDLSEQGHSCEGILISSRTDGRNIDLLTPMLWSECEQWSDTTVGHRGAEYKAKKQEWAEKCIRLAEQQVPGLSSAVQEIYTSTPLTYRDYNAIPEGSAYGIRKDCTLPLMTILTPRTPVPNLLMTGQNLMLHGLHGVTMTVLFTCAEVLGKEAVAAMLKQ